MGKIHIILIITSLLLSRSIFFFIDDPEGPNLVVVIGLALIIYFMSSVPYMVRSSFTSLKKLSLAISIQVLLVIILSFIL
jgi:O-antigen/teichoic acid export membrane protein